jgi:hypothetical protein
METNRCLVLGQTGTSSGTWHGGKIRAALTSFAYDGNVADIETQFSAGALVYLLLSPEQRRQ